MADNDRMLDVILEEVRVNREEIKELRKEIATLRTRFAVVAICFGVAGGKLSTLLPFIAQDDDL